MTLKSQDKNKEWNNIMWIVFKMQTGLKKKKKIDSECYSEGLTCV